MEVIGETKSGKETYTVHCTNPRVKSEYVLCRLDLKTGLFMFQACAVVFSSTVSCLFHNRPLRLLPGCLG